MDELERIWRALLSGDPTLIKTTWNKLTEDEAQSIGQHLKRMIAEADYSEVQREAARQALAVIEAKG